MQNTNLTAGMHGKDNGHDFRVEDIRPGVVEIEYTEDGKSAVFQANRFEWDKGVLQLR